MGKVDIITKGEFVNYGIETHVEPEISKSFTTKVKEDTFYMTFIEYIAPLYKLNSDNARRILCWLCTHAEYNTGKVSLTAAMRAQMAEECEICPNTITNNLKKLKDIKLISGERGEFQINPQIFWKGDLNARKELLKNAELKITFDIV